MTVNRSGIYTQPKRCRATALHIAAGERSLSRSYWKHSKSERNLKFRGFQISRSSRLDLKSSPLEIREHHRDDPRPLSFFTATGLPAESGSRLHAVQGGCAPHAAGNLNLAACFPNSTRILKCPGARLSQRKPAALLSAKTT